MNRKLKIILIPSIIVSTLVLLTIEIRKTVAILVDEQVFTTTLWGFTVADALKSAQISFYEGDEITPNLNQRIRENQIIQIKRSAWVLLITDNEAYSFWTTERNPILLFQTAGVDLQPTDRIYLNGRQINPGDFLPNIPVITIRIKSSTPVRIEDEDGFETVQSPKAFLMEALWDVGLELSSSDKLSPGPLTPLTGEAITASLERSKEIVISSGDRVFQNRVLGETVGDALSEAGFPLQGLNYSIPNEDQPVPSDGRIRVIKVHEEFVLEQEFIPFAVEYIPSQEINLDNQQVIQTGEYGILTKRVRVLYEDGQEISRTVAETWTAKPPKPRQVGYGTKVTINSINTPDGPVQYYRAVEAYATSYSPCRIGISGQCSNRTASGAELKKGVVGVIRSWYNYMKGATVYIPGYGFGTIEDIGAGFSDRYWVDLGYSDEDWVSWSSYVTVYFLLPIPSNILYILD